MTYFKPSTSYAALVAALLFYLNAPVVGLANSCVPLLTGEQVDQILARDAQLRNDFQNRLRVTIHRGKPALIFEREIESDHPDGPRYLFHLADFSRPFSTLGETSGNPQGAHQFTAMTVGMRIARLLGIVENPYTHTVILPSARRIQAGIERLNRFLPEDQQILWSFYEDNGKSESLAYILQVARALGLPISADLRIHDINYHLGAILIPNIVTSQIQRHTQLLADFHTRIFSDFEQKVVSNPEWAVYRPMIETIFNELLITEVEHVDTMTGNFTDNWVTQDLISWHYTYIEQGLSMLTLTAGISEMQREAEYEQILDLELREWIQTEVTQHLDRVNADIGIRQLSFEQLNALIRARRIQLEQAAVAVEALL